MMAQIDGALCRSIRHATSVRGACRLDVRFLLRSNLSRSGPEDRRHRDAFGRPEWQSCCVSPGRDAISVARKVMACAVENRTGGSFLAGRLLLMFSARQSAVQGVGTHQIAILESHELLGTHIFLRVLIVGRHAFAIDSPLSKVSNVICPIVRHDSYLWRTPRRRFGEFLNRSRPARHRVCGLSGREGSCKK